VRLIVNLKGLEQLRVLEMSFLTSFKREIDQHAGIIQLCHLNPALAGYFHNYGFAEQFEIFPDLEGATQSERNTKDY